VVDEVVMPRVEDPGATTVAGVNVEVVPAGRPLTDRLTLPPKPPLEPTETL
jgi:hypothetical protein